VTAARGGAVYLVGAGPGDPGLITTRALELVASADSILHDRLIPPSILAAAGEAAELVDVGKVPGKAEVAQEEIEAMLIDRARAGLAVVRLKGGDPFVFGRGGEELEALRAHGIDAEVVPGITAGTAVPAALGIPVTHRGFARGVTFLTGHTQDGNDPDWAALVRSRTTLVIYMGLKNLEHIVAGLKGAGMDPATPACLVENGTLASQRQSVATLGTLSATGFTGPALIVIGEVVRFARGAASRTKARAA